jgi:hypothetical protein
MLKVLIDSGLRVQDGGVREGTSLAPDPGVEDSRRTNMTARSLALVASLSLLAGPVLADNAVRRGGGGGGGGGGSRDRNAVGARHHGGGGPRGGGGYRPVSGAEARHPRAGTGARNGGYYGGGYYGGGYYGRGYGRYGGYYRPYYGGYYGYRPYYGYGYGYYPYYSYSPYWYPWGGSYWGLSFGYGWGGWPYYSAAGAYYADSSYPAHRSYETGSLRLIIHPVETQVFVDGYYTGDVDDFDGMFQRLELSPGRHDITLRHEGYRDHKIMLYVSPDRTLKIKHEMERGSGPETVADLTEGRSDEAPPQREAWRARDEEGEEPAPRPRARDLGSLRIDVLPGDASVYVDGEFAGTARRLGALELPAGRHVIEIVRPGYKTVERQVEIAPGSSERLAVDLERS